MKRCPQCLFIYPETDTRCDFDNTALVVIDDAEIEAVTRGSNSTPKKSKRTSKKRQPKSVALTPTSGAVTTDVAPAPAKRRRKTKVVIVAVGLLISVVGFFVYYSLSPRKQQRVEAATVASVTAQPVSEAQSVTETPQPALVSPAPTETASPAPSPSASPKQTREGIATSHSRATAAPVSTSGPGIGKKLGGRTVILLSSGGKIDADEVWRTRDGVWYRRNGIVTLLKHNRVKAIANQ
jgi:hypothetical protein